MPPLVSLITPTYGRARLLAETKRWVESQTHANLEWLVLDDSPQPNALLSAAADPRLRYVHEPARRTIGAKRNRLVDMARGSYIVHFDDDDYYAPTYVETMITRMQRDGADFASLCSWYVYDLRHDFFGFWAMRTTEGLHFGLYADGIKLMNLSAENNSPFRDNYLGYGFTYAYTRRAWEAGGFGDVNWNEEAAFIAGTRARYPHLAVADETGLVLHVAHPISSSTCFPQYRLPTFLLPRLFPAPSGLIGQLRRAALAAQSAGTNRPPATQLSDFGAGTP
jgi:glycosyltransferase involved in cell wall biosynthesis